MIGSIRRDCLDRVIPINERHLSGVVKEFVAHYNRGRPHMSLGPGIPEPLQAEVPSGVDRHKCPMDTASTRRLFWAVCITNMA